MSSTSRGSRKTVRTGILQGGLYIDIGLEGDHLSPDRREIGQVEEILT